MTSEKPRRKKRDDTWTSEELTSALHKNNDRPHRRDKTRNIEDSHSREVRKEKHSSHRVLDEDNRKHRSKNEDQERRHKERREVPEGSDQRREKRERREKSSRHEIRDEEDYRREKEKRREERHRKREEEGRSERRNHETPEERAKRKEKERRQREREEKRGSATKDGERRERKHERREDQHQRNAGVEEEEEQRRRRERKEEKRRKRKEAEEIEQESKYKDSEGNKRQREKSRSQVKEPRTKNDEDEKYSKVITSEKEEVNNDEVNYDYDDDFEDYEDDFEENESDEERNPEVDAIIRAINQENERVNSARTNSATSERMQSNRTTSDHDSASSRSHDMVATTINFSGAKQRSVESKTRKRVLNRRNDLLTLIQLDFNSFDLFDLAPVTEYNFYIKNFGSQNSGQASTQCNDDAIEIEIQTDQPEVGDRWSQHPPDGAIACGGTTVTEDSPHLRMLAAMRDDSNRFSEFLVYASDIIDSSFEEALLWRGNKPNSFTPITSCDASTKFNTNIPYLHGRKILHTIFGNGMIAVTFGEACHDVTTRIDQRGIITVWKVSNNEQPYRILICDASPVTCCFAHNKKILFVGTNDGCVLLYDLTEPTTMHQQMELEKNTMTVMRNATYTTGWQNEIHTSPIVCLGSVGSFENMSQLFSIDESARLCVWVVVDIISDVDDDVGLVPHGRVKLVKSSSINVISNKPSSSGLGGSATFAVCPDSNTFYVGTDLGDVISCTRENKTRTYNLPDNKSSVTSISFNQFISTLMLVSYKSGDIALFMLDRDTPVISWPLDGTSILSCDWSNSRPSVFFSLDSTNHLQVWDLMAMDAAPVSDDSFEQKVICFSVDGHSQKSTNLLVAFDSCEFEILKMKSHFVNSVSTDEVEQMMSLVQSFG